MSFASILSPQAVIAELKASSKKQVLQEMSHCAAHLIGISGREILHVLLQREQLGSTAQGKGVAVPHGKMEGLETMIAVFARLPQPVSFEALDEEDVDLVFLLLAPQSTATRHSNAQHLKMLAKISRLMRQDEVLEKLRASNDRDAIHSILVNGT